MSSVSPVPPAACLRAAEPWAQAAPPRGPIGAWNIPFGTSSASAVLLALARGLLQNGVSCAFPIATPQELLPFLCSRSS